MTNASSQQSFGQPGEASLHAKLGNARMGLLDLSARNRLLNTPRSGKNARTIEIVDERSAEIFRLLVREERALTFSPGRAAAAKDATGKPQASEEELEEIADLTQPEDESLDERGVLRRHSDLRLQTRLTSKGLQKRLFEMHGDSVLLEQEQGVNILFLALGMLKWIDPNNPKNIRYAPLILVPVTLERGTAADRFKLKWRHEDQSSNLSLEAYLDQTHGLKMPAFDIGEDCDPAAYCQAVTETVALKEGWAVLPDDIVLGFFSFAKFLMYRDLDPECWPEQTPLTGQPMMRALLAEGFAEPPLTIGDDAAVDPHIAPRDMLHVADCDSSQMLAVHEVRQGRNLVIQGPPGTGKSQTIANVIAAAVADGRTVLFVAEKMVALDVVKRRLDRSGVGDACLELHSNKTNKRALLQELKRTWELGAPRASFPENLSENLENERDILNHHSAAMHADHAIARLTPFQVIGELTELLRVGQTPVDFELPDAPRWDTDETERRRQLLDEFADRLREIGLPRDHPWVGVGLTDLMPTDVERLVTRIAGLKRELDALALESDGLARTLHLPNASTPGALDSFALPSERLAGAPGLSQAAMASDAWESPADEVAALLAHGAACSAIGAGLTSLLLVEAFAADVDEDRKTLAALVAGSASGRWDGEAFDRLRRLSGLIPDLEEQGVRLRNRLGIAEEPLTLHALRRLIRTGNAIAQAPDATPEAFASAVWDHGLEEPADLAEAAAKLEQARSAVEGRLLPEAWNSDLSTARRVLASHGDGLMRHLSGEWRSANRLVRSVLNDPKLPVGQVLGLLDALAQGKEARSLLQQDDAFGRQAFGAHWRGDRSAAKPLLALVAWMRSLPGIDKEARSIVARLPDRGQFGPLAERAERLADEFTAVVDALPPFPILETALRTDDPCELSQLRELLKPILEAEARTRLLFWHLPKGLSERLDRLAELLEFQRLRNLVVDKAALGDALFGDRWHGTNSDWAWLRSAADWLHANGELRIVASELPDPAAPLALLRSVLTRREPWAAACADLLRDLQITFAGAFSEAVPDVRSVTWTQLSDRMDGWLKHPEQLSKWVAYRDCEERIGKLALTPLVQRICDGRVPADAVRQTFDMAYFEGLLRDQLRLSPALARFDGSGHSRVVQRFVELDRSRIAASAVEVVQAHHRRIPVGGGVGPIGILRGEIARKSRHLPIRQLMQKAAPVIQALKPVMMMSPLSVAQFLPPGKLTFDLLVMDEASQIQPVDALGAIARCRQIVVVGDERQLPPTRFFAKMTSNADDEEDDDDDGAEVADVESVLGLCIARGLPQRMLRWHYRSRHESLIAVSNSEFYEQKLSIIPSPYLPEAGMGLRFHHVPNGVFYPAKSSGKNGPSASADLQAANPMEARTVAEAVMRHALECPGESIGVATFSMAQKRAIEQQIETLRRLNPDTEAFFHKHAAEPFFVKNLENVQGDERDVIMISVGYGRDPDGRFAMRFGPLANDGGERRLNVLISRAKLRCIVYASITDEEIDTERAKSKGVFALKLFLHYARTGRLAMTKSADVSQRKSAFVSQLATALRERGHLLREQIGIAGCFIDIAIVHQEIAGRYLIGIECDGPGYHSARSARDRDRLRKSVLEDHGWILHRVWSLDWFRRPQEQMAALEKAIESARSALLESAALPQAGQHSVSIELVTVDREDVTERGLRLESALVPKAIPYMEAVMPRPSMFELHETPTGLLANLIEGIVAIEGPLHMDELVVRVRTIWGLQRAGQRIQAAVERAVAASVQTKKIARSGEFLSIPGGAVVPRDRSHVTSISLRRPEMICPDEIGEAILDLTRNSFGATREEIVQSCARTFGYAAVSTQFKSLLHGTLDTLVERNLILPHADLFVAAP